MEKIIKTLNMPDYTRGGEAEKAAFVAELKEALETTGFFFLRNHGIAQQTVGNARRVFDAFFQQLPEELRLKYEFAEEQHQRGYTPMRIEKGEFAKIADEKHFFQVGDDRAVNVTEIPGFKEAADTLFAEFREQSLVLLRAIAVSLGLDEAYFDGKEGNSIMRAIDYPPTENPLVDDGIASEGGNITGMCATKHTDINMITLLLAQEEGLQLWHKDEWLPITIEDPELIIINAGDMLQHLTGGRYRSGLHRVVCQRNVRRFSIPYFCHVKLEESLVPLEHLGASDLERFHFKTAGEYLNYRLQQIGL
ncbi:MAG: isopenicillin N synthase family oxygenase [Flavipsychrobacter sp.]|nr:isopenicillin N synthase family oxygenase [Flavipsychrobacter sp.]